MEKFIFYDKNYKVINDVNKAFHFKHVIINDADEIIEETNGDIE